MIYRYFLFLLVALLGYTGVVVGQGTHSAGAHVRELSEIHQPLSLLDVILLELNVRRAFSSPTSVGIQNGPIEYDRSAGVFTTTYWVDEGAPLLARDAEVQHNTFLMIAITARMELQQAIGWDGSEDELSALFEASFHSVKGPSAYIIARMKNGEMALVRERLLR